MISAILAVRQGVMGYMKIARTHNVPQTTLERYVKMEGSPEDIVNSHLGRKIVFSEEMESMRACHCLEMERRFFGITQKDVRRLAYSLSKVTNIFRYIIRKNTFLLDVVFLTDVFYVTPR